MDKTVKERLIGAAVLLTLGVIFIPWILDGSPAKIKDSENLQLPLPNGTATHELNFKDGNLTKVDLPVPATDSAENVTDDATDDTSTTPSPQSKQSDSTKTSEKTDTGTNTTTATKTTTPQAVAPTKSGHIDRSKETATASIPAVGMPAASTPAASTSGSDTSKTDVPVAHTPTVGMPAASKPAASKPAASTEIERVAGDPRSAWVVQVGSFGNKNNAEKETAALKAKGFPAFMSRYVTSEKKVLYRVRVGPEKERAQAIKLKERLLKSDIKGQIVAHP